MHRARNHSNQFVEGENLRPDGVEYRGLIVARCVRGDLTKVTRENRLNAIISTPWNREEWKSPQQPRDVVEQDIFDAEDQRRPNDRIGKRRLPDSRFENRLAAEVRERRRLGRVGHADMHELADASRRGRVEHHASVRNGSIEGLAGIRKPDPIGIEERAGAFETSLQLVGAIEIERHRFDLIAKRIRTLQMSSEGLDPPPARQQRARDVSTGVSGCTSDNVEIICHRAFSSIQALLRDSSGSIYLTQSCRITSICSSP